MIDCKRHGHNITAEPTNTDDAPARKSVRTSSAQRMPPPALMCLVMPAARASVTQSRTIDKSGAPERSPPPYFFRGDSLLPNRSCQSIRWGSAPHGIVLETHNASQRRWLAISFTAGIGNRALKFGTKGTRKLTFVSAKSRAL